MIFDGWGSNGRNFDYLTAKHQTSVTDAEDYIRKLFTNPNNRAFHVLASDANELIGLIKADVVGHRAQIGYVVDERFWGKGYATEALNLMVSALLKDISIQRIWATCSLENKGSSRVLERAGFEREGVLKNWVVYPALGEQPHDNYSYVYLSEWRQAADSCAIAT